MSDQSVEGFRLSPQQRHTWALMQRHPTHVYQTQGVIALHGPLEPEGLRTTLARLIEQHEILRTAYHRLPGISLPIQLVQDAVPPPGLDVDGWQDLSEAEQATRLEQRLAEWRTTAHDEALPSLRATLVALGNEHHWLLLSLPALAADAMSLVNLFLTLAHAEREDEEVVQYADVASVFNDLLEAEETEVGRRYWNRPELSALRHPPLPLSADGSFRPHTLSLPIPADVAAPLDALAARAGVTQESVLLATWHLLLARLDGQEAGVVGLAATGRVYEGLDSAQGLYLRHVPHHLRVQPRDRFTDLLRATHQESEAGAEWHDAFDLEAWPPARAEEGADAFFPVAFESRTWPGPLTVGPLTFALTRADACPTRFLLKGIAEQRGEQLVLTIAYDAARIPTEEAVRLLERWATLLGRLAASPDRPLGDLDILTQSEQAQLLVALNQTEQPYPQDKCIHHLFEEQVRRTPDALAVVFGDQHLTYQALNQRANQVAHVLRGLGVGRKVRVGLYMERSVEMIIGLLGVLKAGGAYVPLDPTHPAERINYIEEDARVAVMVTQSWLKETLPAQEIPVVCLDRAHEAERFRDAPTTNPTSRVAPQSLAYIIYTSGSTGRPKGVMIPHTAVVNLSVALHERIYRHHGAALRLGLSAPLTFDGSVKQWIQLLTGHTLYILPEEVRPDPYKFQAFVADHQLDGFDCTPTQLKRLLAIGFSEAEYAPQLVLVGGEAIDERTWGLLNHNRRTTFYNMYGPTECTVNVTAAATRGNALPTLGYFLPNVRGYLLDSQMQPVPPGTPGELYVGGAGVARGYSRQPRQTAERFVPDPFSPQPGARLYRTGDLMRHLPDGRLHFLGRVDHQVKFLGFRIELGEIESELREHPAVHEAVVLLHTQEPTHAADERAGYLAAFIEPNDPAADPTELQATLRHFLRERLPEYMVPTVFLVLPKLPLNPHGKVNRHALPDPQFYLAATRVPYEAPRNQAERTIVALWQEILNVEKVGVHDNFFDLGGHSLLMVQLFDRLQEAFEKQFSMIEMFRYPTVSALAEYIAQVQPAAPELPDVDEQAQRQKAARERQKQRAQKGR